VGKFENRFLLHFLHHLTFEHEAVSGYPDFFIWFYNDLDQTTDKASCIVGKLALEIAISFKVIKKSLKT